MIPAELINTLLKHFTEEELKSFTNKDGTLRVYDLLSYYYTKGNQLSF